MGEEGIEPGKDFKIRNPWIPRTPGKPIPSGSNGISLERNWNSIERRNWSQLFELLDKRQKQMENCNSTGNNCNLDETLNQSSGLYSMTYHQTGNGILRDGNNFELTGRMNQNSSSNCTGNYLGAGIMQGGISYNLNEPLNKSIGSYSMADHQMRNGILQGENNFNLAEASNQISSSNGTGNRIRNGIKQGSNNSHFAGQLNQISSSNARGGNQMGNGIFQSGNNCNVTEPFNQISSSNSTGNQIGNRIIQGGNNSNFTRKLNRISSSNTTDDYQTGKGALKADKNYNFTGRINKISSLSGPGNYIGNGIIQGGNNSNTSRPLNRISSSNTADNNQMGNGTPQGGNSYNITGRMNQSSSSKGTGDYIVHGLGGNNSNFTGMLNQISSSNSGVNHQMGNENLGNYLKSETQTLGKDIPSWSNSPVASNRGLIVNKVQQPMFPAMSMPPVMIPKTDSVTSSPLLNLYRQPLSSPRVMNSPNAPLVLDSYSEVDNSWTEGNFTSLLLGDEIFNLGPNSNCLMAPNSPQMLNNGFHVPRLHDNNLNTPARHNGDARTRNANSFPFAPITPDHANLLEQHRQAEMLQFLLDDDSSQEPDKVESLLSSIENEAIKNHCSELLQTTVGASSTVVTTPQAENRMIDEKGDQDVIDLNETPKQKAPKKRKHRPKVVREDKPKRTPKTATHKNSESEKKPSKKRKYVRKNRDPEVQKETPQETNAINTVKVPTREESCRKRLNFDFEKAEKGESRYTTSRVQMAHHQSNQPVLDLNLSLNYPVNQMLVESVAVEESHDPTAPSEIINYNTSIVIAKNSTMRNNENQENQNVQGDLKKNISRVNLNLERSRVIRWKSTHQMVERDVGNFKGFCGSKGEDSHPHEQADPTSKHKLGSQSMCQEPIRSENQETINPKIGNLSKETRKKQKTGNDFQTKLSGAEKEQPNNGTYDEDMMNVETNLQRKLTILNQQMALERMKERMSCRSTQVQSIIYLPVMSNSNLQSALASKNADASGYQQGSENCQAAMHNNRLKITPNPCRVISFCSNEVPLHASKDTSHPYQQPSIKARGQPKPMKYSKKAVEEITYRLQSLTISGENGETYGEDNYALVPYEGRGTMIPYEPRKRKPRPKVDLDPETARLWKLLMGKEGSEASEAENKDKEKWWEEERRVFHGRAESFIARMHLVQGDRRFSPWKGSVVDSIVGVFLTQNVSDQLSSSAFMALAAQFPLCSTTTDQTNDQSGTSILTEEPEIQGLAPHGTRRCFEKIVRQPFCSHTSEIYLGSLATGKIGLATEPNRISKDNASSPQNSFDSSVYHVNGEIRSSSGSSSETEDSSNGMKYIKNNALTSVQHANRTASLQVVKNPETEHLGYDDKSMHYNKQSTELNYKMQKERLDQFNSLNSFFPVNPPIDSSITNMQNSIMPPNYFQMLMASQVARSEVNCYEISREECKSFFPSGDSQMTKEKCIGHWDNRVGHATVEMMSNTLFQQNNLQNNETPNMEPFAFLTKHLTTQKNGAQQEPQIGKDPHSLNTHQVKSPQINESEHIGFKNQSRPTQPVIIRKSGSVNQVPDVSKHTGQTLDIQEGKTAVNKQVTLGGKPTDGHTKGQASFSGETNTKISVKTLKTSQNNEKEKRESFDWDSLRKLVQSNGREKERSMDVADSMDYEAMRCADVNVISNSIRMRGMNHMLAERIKDFLNRVVTDHGSINLEWLRDVPPDKAKDYLLSIRGLGLKSVECVRLLTLHHLAFPVDTNVGRIAVRLGWVPLQPLPESLQLHLLEMYPILETVQKYLWPRLCKLDQKTLYELHYQLITFGKVFCTKSKPNCNACPMRGECRHFASAFASARLALPAPDEKGIVGSTMPITTDRRADVAIKPILLQPSSGKGERELMVSSSEPIIEEPATPEPDITEITETDIEDAFYEDPDEIPTIRLNVEQLAVNLRNFMEEHTDLHEGDMSKALVALTPEVASIPVPKLKYVLRLRTERQVYVLSDTHPLVKGLDKREPDDPSPYLLALLAPGEEANSGQSSGRKCESKGSEEVCNEKDCCSVGGEANSLTVRGTLLIPCRTAMGGSFPLNGTYFQVNEVFADHESSLNPIDVPRAWLWHLERRTVFFGTSATSIFRGMTTKEIQNSFWKGFVCVRGFDRKTRAPRPLNRYLHIAQSKTVKTSNVAL